MKVEVNSDARIDADKPAVTDAVESGLSRFKDRLTRVEVHLSDVNGPKGGPDVRCAIEARPAGLHPVAVTNDASTPYAAVKGAVDKLTSLLSSTFGREKDVKGGPSASGLPT
jgi:hypothetical protein